MVLCSSPIFAIFEQSKAARFVSVLVLPTVACCQCIEEEMFYNLKYKKARNLVRQVEETVEDSRIEFLYNILYVKVIYLNCGVKHTELLNLFI